MLRHIVKSNNVSLKLQISAQPCIGAVSVLSHCSHSVTLVVRQREGETYRSWGWGVSFVTVSPVGEVCDRLFMANRNPHPCPHAWSCFMELFVPGSVGGGSCCSKVTTLFKSDDFEHMHEKQTFVSLKSREPQEPKNIIPPRLLDVNTTPLSSLETIFTRSSRLPGGTGLGADHHSGSGKRSQHPAFGFSVLHSLGSGVCQVTSLNLDVLMRT